MKAMIRKLLVTAPVLLAGTFFALSAYAGCPTADGYAAPGGPARLVGPMALFRAAANGIAAERDDQSKASDRTIVGFWHFTFTSEGTTNPPIPNGTVIDGGFAEWHSDKTEITNSSRPPATGNFCLGVFEKTGPSCEIVTVDRDGDRYSGTFSIDQYDTNKNLVAHIVRNVKATRVTINMLISDLF